MPLAVTSAPVSVRVYPHTLSSVQEILKQKIITEPLLGDAVLRATGRGEN